MRSIAPDFCTASSVGGTTEAVERLPPAPGPSGRLESPIRTRLVRLQAEFMRDRIGDHVRLPWPNPGSRCWRRYGRPGPRLRSSRRAARDKPVAGRDPTPLRIAAGLRRARSLLLRHTSNPKPIVQTLRLDWDPSVCAARSDRASSASGFVDRLVQRDATRRAHGTAGTARRAAGC